MKKKYKVTIYYETYIEVEVETNDPEKIETLAFLEAGKKKYDNQFLANAEASDYTEIEEVEDEG